MTVESARAAALHVASQSRQHQEMRQKYLAYDEMLLWIDAWIGQLDQEWHTLALDNDRLQQLRGQKQAWDEMRKYFQGFLTMDISAAESELEGEDESET